MTEVEFSRQLSELSNTAATLNRESDSVNEIIERFEETLRKTNLGLEVWLEEAALIGPAYEKLGDHVPPALWDQQKALLKRLRDAVAKNAAMAAAE